MFSIDNPNYRFLMPRMQFGKRIQGPKKRRSKDVIVSKMVAVLVNKLSILGSALVGSLDSLLKLHPWHEKSGLWFVSLKI